MVITAGGKESTPQNPVSVAFCPHFPWGSRSNDQNDFSVHTRSLSPPLSAPPTVTVWLSTSTPSLGGGLLGQLVCKSQLLADEQGRQAFILLEASAPLNCMHMRSNEWVPLVMGSGP